jgi:hypothetical protein
MGHHLHCARALAPDSGQIASRGTPLFGRSRQPRALLRAHVRRETGTKMKTGQNLTVALLAATALGAAGATCAGAHSPNFTVSPRHPYVNDIITVSWANQRTVPRKRALLRLHLRRTYGRALLMERGNAFEPRIDEGHPSPLEVQPRQARARQPTLVSRPRENHHRRGNTPMDRLPVRWRHTSTHLPGAETTRRARAFVATDSATQSRSRLPLRMIER